MRHFALLTGALLTTPYIGHASIVSQPFPATTADLSFSQRNQILTAGYIPFKDAEIYHQIDIATAGLGQEIEELNAQADLEEAQNQNIAPQVEPTEPTPSDNNLAPVQNNSLPPLPVPPLPAPPPPTSIPVPQLNNNLLNAIQQPHQPNRVCAVFQPDIPPNQELPLGHPLLKSDWNEKVDSSMFGVRFNGRDFHHGMDLGCCGKQYYGKPVFSPAGGTVSWVSIAKPGKSCGNGLSIKHANGFRTSYCHLKDAPLYKKGQYVPAGCQIGNVGHTGGRKMDKNPSMGMDMTHLHYEIHYTGTKKYITAPDNTKIKIIKGAKCKDCINPTEWINYHYTP